MPIRNKDCELCPLHESAETVCMLGSGPKDARIMVIGEAPGRTEDEEGKPFRGSAGRVIRSALSQVGIDPAEVFFTNVVRCRPPDNATPDRSQIKTCVTNYMVPEIERVKPEFVIVLGNSALLGIIGKTGITKQAGQVFEVEVADNHWAKIMPTIHPAAVLRNPKWADTFTADIIRFYNLTRGISTSPETRVKFIRSKANLLWLRNVLMEATEISWDVETDCERIEGMKRGPGQDWHGDESLITSIAFTTEEEGKSYVLPISHDDTWWKNPQAVLDFLAPALLRKGVKLIAHNGKFDARWLHSKGIPIRQDFDTMLAAHMLDENRLKGLKPLSKTLLGAEAYDVGEDVKNSRSAPLKQLLVYNAKDTDYTLRLAHLFEDQLRKEPRIDAVFKKLMMPASNALVDVERLGVWVDWERWEERYIVCQENRDKIHRYISQWWPEPNPINLNAPQQVGRLLYEHLGLPILGETSKGAPSTAETHLLRLESKHPAAKALIKWRKWNGYISRYLLPWKLEWADEEGRIHASYKLYGTVTGRLSGEGGIQQVPRDPYIRSIIGAPEGWTFVQADYSQVELRIAAWLADERRMLRQYMNGEDIHMLRAMKMTQKIRPEEVTKEERKRAKPVSFGYIYGMGAPKFVTYAFDNYGVETTLADAKKDRAGFFEDYPALLPWHERQRRLARKYHRVSSPIGRVRHLSDILSSDEKVRGEAERQAINSPVQSFASDLMLTGLITLHKRMDPQKARIIGTVHDSILFEVKDEYLKDYLPSIKETMEDMSLVKKKFGTEVGVPVVVDIETGTHWGEGTEWHG